MDLLVPDRFNAMKRSHQLLASVSLLVLAAIVALGVHVLSRPVAPAPRPAERGSDERSETTSVPGSEDVGDTGRAGPTPEPDKPTAGTPSDPALADAIRDVFDRASALGSLVFAADPTDLSEADGVWTEQPIPERLADRLDQLALATPAIALRSELRRILAAAAPGDEAGATVLRSLGRYLSQVTLQPIGDVAIEWLEEGRARVPGGVRDALLREVLTAYSPAAEYGLAVARGWDFGEALGLADVEAERLRRIERLGTAPTGWCYRRDVLPSFANELVRRLDSEEDRQTLPMLQELDVKLRLEKFTPDPGMRLVIADVRLALAAVLQRLGGRVEGVESLLGDALRTGDPMKITSAIMELDRWAQGNDLSLEELMQRGADIIPLIPADQQWPQSVNVGYRFARGFVLRVPREERGSLIGDLLDLLESYEREPDGPVKALRYAAFMQLAKLVPSSASADAVERVLLGEFPGPTGFAAEERRWWILLGIRSLVHLDPDRALGVTSALFSRVSEDQVFALEGVTMGLQGGFRGNVAQHQVGPLTTLALRIIEHDAVSQMDLNAWTACIWLIDDSLQAYHLLPNVEALRPMIEARRDPILLRVYNEGVEKLREKLGGD